MKRLIATCLLAGVTAVGTTRAADPELKTDDDKAIYALGLFLGSRAQLNSFMFTPSEIAILQMGIADQANEKPKLDLQQSVSLIQPWAAKRMPQAANQRAPIEKKKGKEFLEPIAAKPTSKKTPSGAVYEVVTEGKGTSPVRADSVKVNYRGTLVDGREFDSSAGSPVTFKMTQLVRCWGEVLEFMKPGGKVKLYCPSDSAYGDTGHGANIPPGATLVFDLELIEIVKPDAPAK
jgi:FKBP-type peptidyl-prolyl cis-trans isomerase